MLYCSAWVLTYLGYFNIVSDHNLLSVSACACMLVQDEGRRNEWGKALRGAGNMYISATK